MAELKEGEPAPAFTAQDQNNKMVSLSDFKGKKLVLYFYPKDDTPGCTAEACNIRDNISELRSAGYEVLGVSPDDAASHAKFAGKYNLPFQLIEDPDKEISKAYGVWGEKNMYGRMVLGIKRTTFLINEDGIIDKIIKRVKTKEHSEQILGKA